MPRQQRAHEDYWRQCWEIPLGRHLKAKVQSTLAAPDPPDFEFEVLWPDATTTRTWGELTGAYYSASEAKWLWGTVPASTHDAVYVEPDAAVALEARTQVEKKSQKYSDLVRRAGKGHLLVLLHSPLTTRSTRVAAETAICDALNSSVSGRTGPFASVWLGYCLGFTSPSEQEDPKYVFRDPTGGDRLDFLKCIWVASSS